MAKKQHQTIYRTVKNRENPYVMIDKNIFTDTRLSWKAKGLLGYFLSRPDNWTIRIDDLVKQSKDGRDSVYSGLRELKKCGYIVQVAYRLKNGRIDHFEHHVYEQPLENPPEGIVYIDMEEEGEETAEDKAFDPFTENPEVVPPVTEKPLTENPYMENPYTENPTLLINESTNNRKRIKNDKSNKQQHREPKNEESNTCQNDKCENVVVELIHNEWKKSFGEEIDQKKVRLLLKDAGQDETKVIEAIKKVATTMTPDSPIKAVRYELRYGWDQEQPKEQKPSAPKKESKLPKSFLGEQQPTGSAVSDEEAKERFKRALEQLAKTDEEMKQKQQEALSYSMP